MQRWRSDHGAAGTAVFVVLGASAAVVGVAVIIWFRFGGARDLALSLTTSEVRVDAGYDVSVNFTTRYGSRSVQNDFQPLNPQLRCGLTEKTITSTVFTTSTTESAPISTGDRETTGTLRFRDTVPRRGTYYLDCVVTPAAEPERALARSRVQVRIGHAPTPSPSPSPSPSTTTASAGISGTYSVIAAPSAGGEPGCHVIQQGEQLVVTENAGAITVLEPASGQLWQGALVESFVRAPLFADMGNDTWSLRVFAFPDERRIEGEFNDYNFEPMCAGSFIATIG